MDKFLKSIVTLLLALPLSAWAANFNGSISAAAEPKNLIFIAGQRTGEVEIPDRDGSAIKQAFDQLREIAIKNGATMDDVLQVTIYLADPANDYPLIRGIVKSYFIHPENIARSIVAVTRIPDGNDEKPFGLNRRIEIDAVLAVKPTH